MTVIVVANPKGGVGKSTLATNLAGYFAANGEWVALADLDKQRSAHAWLALRADTLPRIEEWEVDIDAPSKPPKGLEKAVVDTPAGVHGNRLALALELADKVIVPLQPSMFDILATQEFLQRLSKEKAVRKGAIEIGVVGMRVDARTRSADQLHRFVEGLESAGARVCARYAELCAACGARADDLGCREEPRGEGPGTVAADRGVGGEEVGRKRRPRSDPPRPPPQAQVQFCVGT